MVDFLLELRSEEMPARMQEKARDDLARLFTAELAKAGITASAITTYATPRRLALIARDLPLETAATSEETKGPKTSAPPQALEGFLRKTGLTREQLVDRDGVLFAVIDKPGRATASVLAEAIPAIVRAFPWPKSMRWGSASTTTESLKWVRPLQGIVALLGEQIVPVEIAGVASSAATVGHRFHHPGIITIGTASDYVEKLRACHVIVDQDERRQIIALGATMAARKAGLELIEDDGLLTENAGLTEWPVPLLGRFDAAFLGVPPEVIQLTARVNQKYFVCRDADGKLANAFICTANIDAVDGGEKIVEGNRKVLAARLSDAKFFYDTDLKVPLDVQREKLSQIVFHEKLGTVADKVDRVAKLARWLVEEGIVTSSPLPFRGGVGGGAVPHAVTPAGRPHPNPSPEGEGLKKLATQAERAARLCKADLVTGMVGEFPELQGLIGGYYALAQGEDPEVAEAIRDHYKTPVAPVSVALALADRLDTLQQFFAIDEKPTGSRDPFALRRAAIQSLFMIMRGLRLDLSRVISKDVIDFIVERWMVQNKTSGGRPDLIAAVAGNVCDPDLWRMGQRMRALETFVGTPDGANLLAGYKRAANILKKEGVAAQPQAVTPAQAGVSGDGAGPEPHETPAFAGVTNDHREGEQKTLSYTPEKDEAALIAALDSAGPRAQAAVEAEDFEGAMAALATLRTAVDAFFETVTVNDPDPAKRAARLALLARVRAAVHSVADFSKIDG